MRSASALLRRVRPPGSRATPPPAVSDGKYRDNRPVPPIYVTGHRNPDTDSIAVGDRLRRAQGPARPAQRVRPRPPRRLQLPDAVAAGAQRRPRAPPSAPRDAPRPRRDADELSGHPPGRARPRGRTGDGQGRPRAGADRRRRRRAGRRADRARAGAPLHPRLAAHLDARGGADAGQRGRLGARGRADLRRRRPHAVGTRVGLRDGSGARQRDRRGRRGRRRQPAGRAGPGARARRRADRAVQLRARPRERAGPGPQRRARRSSSRRWTATCRDG